MSDNIDETAGSLSSITDAAAAKEIGKLWRAFENRTGASHPDQNNLPDHVFVTRADLATLRNEVAKRVDALPLTPPRTSAIGAPGTSVTGSGGTPSLSSLTITAASASVNQTVALLVTAPAGGGYFRAGLSLGAAGGGRVTCDIGLDLGFCHINTAAIVVPDGTPIVFSPNAAALIRYKGGQFTFEVNGNIKSFINTAGELGISTLTAISVRTTGFTCGTLDMRSAPKSAAAGAQLGYFTITLAGAAVKVPYYAP